MSDRNSPREPQPRSTRGMCTAPYTRDGYPVVELTDSRGRCIATVTLVRGVEPRLVRRFFREIIDAADPVKPRIALVRDANR